MALKYLQCALRPGHRAEVPGVPLALSRPPRWRPHEAPLHWEPPTTSQLRRAAHAQARNPRGFIGQSRAAGESFRFWPLCQECTMHVQVGSVAELRRSISRPQASDGKATAVDPE